MNPYQQRGAALIVSLIILLVLTIIGVTSMQTTTMQERMAGNLRDQSIAFETGEAALREMEQYASNQDYPIWYDLGEGPAYGYHFDDDDDDALPGRREGLIGTSLTSGTVDGLNIDETADAPDVWIEQVRDPLPPCMNIGECEDDYLEEDQMFRIVVKARGGSTDARALLQSTFRSAPQAGSDDADDD